MKRTNKNKSKNKNKEIKIKDEDLKGDELVIIENENIEEDWEPDYTYYDTEFRTYTSRNYNLLDLLYDYFLFSCNFFYKIIRFIFNISGIYLLWIFLHYVASHLYVKLCVPNTIIGFIMSPFMTSTPHCQGLRWIVYNAANMINNMWSVLGTWICANVLVVMNSNMKNDMNNKYQHDD
jgi:hypothetical protein